VQTRRDQMQAYRFLTRRALAALVTGEPNAVDPPMRRLTLTTISGVMIAALVAAGFAFVGLIRPNVGDKWKQSGTIIVERQTGARYVLLDNVLHPVLNYSSAVLAVTAQAQSNAKVVLVDRSDLQHTKRGAAIGIDGIPDSLPSSGSLISSPWSACSRQQVTEQTTVSAKVTLYVGSDPGTRAIPAAAAAIVRSVDGAHTYLLWHGSRLEINTGQQVDRALNLQTAPTLTVGTAFLNAITPGPSLQTPTVAGLGTPGPSLAGQATIVGQLIAVSNSTQFYVVLPHGFQAVNAVQAGLLRTLVLGPNNARLPQITIDETTALSLPTSAADAAALNRQFDGLPTTLPRIDGTPAQNGGLCAVYRGNADHPAFEVPPSELGDNQPGAVTTESNQSQLGVADTVDLSPGRAAVVGSANGTSTVFVVADPGQRYAAASVAALAGFGYSSVKPVTLPAGVVAMIPAGPALDATAARRPAAG
jgi:type VII secretion protein EccB